MSCFHSILNVLKRVEHAFFGKMTNYLSGTRLVPAIISLNGCVGLPRSQTDNTFGKENAHSDSFMSLDESLSYEVRL